MFDCAFGIECVNTTFECEYDGAVGTMPGAVSEWRYALGTFLVAVVAVAGPML